MKSNQVQIKINDEDKALIQEAAKIQSMGHSTFTRMAAINLARQILAEHGLFQQGDSQTAN